MNNLGSNIAGGLFILAVVLVIIFLVFREVFCWYWKINRNVALLTEIRDLLAKMENPRLVTASPAQAGIGSEKLPSTPPQNGSATDCESTLTHLGYEVTKLGAAGWAIREPLGGRLSVKTLQELVDYTNSAKLRGGR